MYVWYIHYNRLIEAILMTTLTITGEWKDNPELPIFAPYAFALYG